MKLAFPHPPIHFSHTPTLVHLQSVDRSREYADLKLVELSADGTHSEKEYEWRVELMNDITTVNIQAYVKSMFDRTDRQLVRYVLYCNNYPDPLTTSMAIRGAVQLGQCTTALSLTGKFLTDYTSVAYYEGYPCSVSALSDGDTHLIIKKNTDTTISKQSIGITNLPITQCYANPLELLTLTAELSGYYCQLENVLFYVYPDVYVDGAPVDKTFYANGALSTQGGKVTVYNNRENDMKLRNTNVFSRYDEVGVTAEPSPSHFLSAILVDGKKVNDSSCRFIIYQNPVPSVQIYLKAYTYDAFYSDYQCQQENVFLKLNVMAAGKGSTVGTGEYNRYANVQLSASPETGYRFTAWRKESGQLLSTSNPYIHTVTKAETVYAHFTPIVVSYEAAYSSYQCQQLDQKLTLTVTTQGGGSVSGGGQYNRNDKAALTATPHTGYRFLKWHNSNGATISTSPDYAHLVTADETIYADFSAIQVSYEAAYSSYECQKQ